MGQGLPPTLICHAPDWGTIFKIYYIKLTYNYLITGCICMNNYLTERCFAFNIITNDLSNPYSKNQIKSNCSNFHAKVDMRAIIKRLNYAYN